MTAQLTDPVAPPTTPETPPPTAVQPPAAPEAPKVPESPWDDPVAAKAEIERLRKENGAERVNAKKQAADDARAELTQSLAKALGIVKDEPLDPAQLTQELTAAQSTARQAQVDLAVYRNAATAGADPSALLDSSSFLKSLADIDPNDAAAVQVAITAAVTANPRLGAETEPRTPAPNPAQGAAGGGAPGLDDQIAAATKAGNHALAIALKRQQAYAVKP